MPFGHRPPTFKCESWTQNGGEAVHETYRMLGREHELDLEREARNRSLAAALPAKPAQAKTPAEKAPVEPASGRARFVPRPLVAWLAR